MCLFSYIKDIEKSEIVLSRDETKHNIQTNIRYNKCLIISFFHHSLQTLAGSPPSTQRECQGYRYGIILRINDRF